MKARRPSWRRLAASQRADREADRRHRATRGRSPGEIENEERRLSRIAEVKGIAFVTQLKRAASAERWPKLISIGPHPTIAGALEVVEVRDRHHAAALAYTDTRFAAWAQMPAPNGGR